MAKRKSSDSPAGPAGATGRGGGGRKTAPVQVEKDLARMAAVIASHDGITQSDLVSPALRPFLRMHYERVQKEIQENLRRMGPGGP